MKLPRLHRVRLAVLGIVLGLAGCSGEATPQRYFPLAPGYHWQYRIERTTMDGTQRIRQAVWTVAVPATLDVSGMRETLGGQRLLYVDDGDGIERLQTQRTGGPRNAPQRVTVLPATLVVGTQWHQPAVTTVLENTGPPWETLFRISVPVELEYRIESLAASVDTPAGHFDDCLLVTGRGQAQADVGNYIGRTMVEIEVREWYAEDVGLVRMERDEKTGAAALSAGRLVMELDTWSDD
ncbi:MAG: hypothetical protein H6977_06515 [Gammaproteobacteria bacterium]|nr:hypothetical protein [Gammaproteobacteria bacterium]MCP5199645.1 hypothetical protein [Gammaproteobacteria bacterium]